MSGAVLVFDCGTTELKAALFNEDFTLIAAALCSYQTANPQSGWAEQSPEDWWAAVRSTTQQISAKHPEALRTVEAISCTGQMMGLLPIQRDGTLLLDSVPIWADSRARNERTEFMDAIGGYEEFYNIVRQGMTPELYSLFKIIWMKKNRPDIFEKADYFINAKDFLGHRLTGELATDPSDMACTCAYDVVGRSVSEKILNAVGFSTNPFPTVLNPTERLGTIRAEVAAELGISPTAFVYMGLGDAVAASVGALAINVGDAYFSFGTAAWGGFISNLPQSNVKDQVNVLPHLTPGLYQLQYVMNTGTVAHRWVVETLYGSADFSQAERDVAAVPVDERSLVCLTTLQPGGAPFNNPDARGVFFGASLRHGRGHYVRAVLEGLALNIRILRESVETGSEEMQLETIAAIGGGTKSGMLMQIVADILQCNVRVGYYQQDCTAFGAAVCAGLGSGLLSTVDEIQDLVPQGKLYEPDRSLAENSALRAETYRNLYPRLLPSFQDLAALRAHS